MDKELYCRDVGIDCDLMVCGKTEDEVLTKAGQHVQAMHGIKGFSKEFYNKAQSAIREGNCDDGDVEETISQDCCLCDDACFDCADGCCC